VDCQEARAKMFSYLDHELSCQEEEVLFSHVSFCPDCSFEFSVARETHDLLKDALDQVTPPLDLTERIMAQIPWREEPQGEKAGLGLRIKEYLAAFGDRWKNAFGSWQLRTAMITVGVLALVVLGSMSDFLNLQLPQKRTPDTNIAHVEPGVKEDPEPGEQIPQDNPAIIPEVPEEPEGPKEVIEGEVTPGADNPVIKEAGEPDNTPIVSQKPTKVVPDRDTNIVQLPQAASEETREETIKILSLIENDTQAMSHPVLSPDGKYIHYLYDNAGVVEEWEIELKAGALPQKAQSNLVLGVEDEGNTHSPMPQWLSDMDMIKGAKSKVAAWSPDGKQVAVNLDAAGTEDDGLWIAQPDGAAMVLVAQEGGGNDLVWSPNRMKIAFTDRADNLYVLYLNENLLIQVSDSTEGLVKIEHLFWTPDGQELIFEGRQNEGNTGIYRVALP